MSDNDTLFSVSRLDRKPEFALITSIHKSSNGQMFVVKRPSGGQFSAHFNAIFEAPDKLEPISKGHSPINIIKPSPMGGAVMFPFIKGRSVERILLEKVLKDDQQAAISTISRFLEALDKFPAENCIPTSNEQYKKIFGESFNEICECVQPAVVDLNLDNLIEDGDGKWHLIDYEWTFDFPIPKDYLISRMLLNFFILRYQGVLRSHAHRIRQVEVGSNASMPEYIANKYDKWIRLFPQVIKSESAFQSYVLSKKENLGEFQYISKEHRTAIEPPVGPLEHYFRLQERQTELEAENRTLVNDIANIRSSKTYRAAMKLSKAKNSLRRKNR